MLSSPRRPSKTIRIFSSAEYCLRVARRMSLTTFSAGSFAKLECCLIFAPVNATMSQKHSLLQSAYFVPRVLTVDNDRAAGQDVERAAKVDLVAGIGLTGSDIVGLAAGDSDAHCTLQIRKRGCADWS